jgi:hypothetical protein
MSEADLYRKQRVAIEAVAGVIMEMESQARQENAVAEPANENPMNPSIQQGGLNGKQTKIS